jgi:hypothetical protein
MTTVLCGDSWCCGVWNISSSNITHPGLSQLLYERGVPTINLGIPGGNNRQTIHRVNQFIDQNPQVKIDRLIIFQTGLLRIFKDSELLPELSCKKYADIESFYLTEFYCRLSDISQKINVPVYLIGGVGDTLWYDKFSTEHPGVQIVCQSFTNLLLYDNPRIDNPVTDVFMPEKIYKILSHNKQNLLDAVYSMETRLEIYKNNPQFFFPDGLHPNLLGHEKLYNLLVKTNLI